MNSTLKHLPLFLIMVCNSIFAYSQRCEGTVVSDENNQPIEFANVALYSLPDSVLITGSITNEKGEFILNCENTNNAFLKISFIGYKTQTVEAKPIQTIALKTEALTLGEVVVEGNLPKIRLRNDALVAMVQNTVLSKAGTGNDVLKRLPSITGDNGVFSVFGKGEAKIYINNREMRDISELDNLNSADIREVEIITNPGARYDASVKAVIRINTTPKAGDGFSFDVRSSYYQSQNIDLTEQVNINYRTNGWDFFGTIKYNQKAYIQDSKIKQKTFVDTLWTQENTLYLEGLNRTVTGIAGVNREFSPNHFTGMKYTLSVTPTGNMNTESNSIVLADNVFYDQWKSNEEKVSSNRPSHWINVYYNGSFNDLNVDFNTDFYTNQMLSNSSVTETSQEYDNRTITSENDVNNRLIAAKLVLSYPVLSGRFSFGSEYTDTHRKDKYTNKENIVLPSNTTIKERNNSFFVEYSRAISIVQLGAGLRYENVSSDYFSNQIKVEEQSRRYGQWFPNLSFTSQLKGLALQLSYTAKTKRPTYRQLSSNVYYANRLTLQTGNPFLRSSVIHDVTLVGTRKFIQLMVSYKNEKDAIIYWTEQSAQNPAISVITYRNLEKLPSLTAFLTISPTFGIWSPQLSCGLIKQWLDIESSNKTIRLNKPLPIVSLNNSFSLPKGFIFTFDTSFQGEGDYQNVHLSENRFIADISFVKLFLNNSLRIELKGKDLFRGYKDGNLLYNAQMELYQLNRYDSREVELTVRYKFNSAKSKYKGTGAGESEIKRL